MTTDSVSVLVQLVRGHGVAGRERLGDHLLDVLRDLRHVTVAEAVVVLPLDLAGRHSDVVRECHELQAALDRMTAVAEQRQRAIERFVDDLRTTVDRLKLYGTSPVVQDEYTPGVDRGTLTAEERAR